MTTPRGCAQRLRHHSLMATNHIQRLPLAGTNELLDSAHGIAIRPQQFQQHRLNGLAFHLRQLSAQIQRRPVSLLASIKAVLKQTMIVGQRLANRFLILSRQLEACWDDRWPVADCGEAGVVSICEP